MVNPWDILRELLFALGCATATFTLLCLGATVAVVIERAIVARRRKPEPRWLGDTSSVESIERDELEALWSMPSVEPRHG